MALVGQLTARDLTVLQQLATVHTWDAVDALIHVGESAWTANLSDVICKGMDMFRDVIKGLLHVDGPVMDPRVSQEVALSIWRSTASWTDIRNHYTKHAFLQEKLSKLVTAVLRRGATKMQHAVRVLLASDPKLQADVEWQMLDEAGRAATALLVALREYDTTKKKALQDELLEIANADLLAIGSQAGFQGVEGREPNIAGCRWGGVNEPVWSAVSEQSTHSE